MRKILIIFFIQLSTLFNHVFGQKITWEVIRMELDSMNLSINNDVDENGEPLAKIVLYIPIDSVKIQPETRIKRTGGDHGEYFAFVTAGYRDDAKRIEIQHGKIHPLEIKFEDWGFPKIEGQKVYRIWVKVDSITTYGLNQYSPESYDPDLKWFMGLGINTSFQFAPIANFGFDCRHWNLWASFSHSLSTSKELIVYNKDNIEQCRHNYHYMRLSLNAGWEWEPWENKTPLLGIMPCIGLAWDRIYSKTKDEIGDGFNAYYILVGTRISLKTNNRRFCFFASPSLNLNIGSNPRKNFDIITNEIVDLKSNFDLQIGAIYYF